MSKNTSKPGEEEDLREEESCPTPDLPPDHPPVQLQDEKEVLIQYNIAKVEFDNSSSLLSIWAKRLLLDIWCQQHHFPLYEFFMR